MKSKLFQVTVFVLVVLLSACVPVVSIDKTETIKVAPYPTYELVEAEEMKWLSNEQPLSKFVPERPDWPNQLDLGDIHEGDILFSVHKDSQTKYLIIKSPYMEKGVCKFDSVYWEDDVLNNPLYIRNNYCSDFGLIKYPSSLSGWNRYNHLIRSEDISLTPKQLEEVISNLQ